MRQVVGSGLRRAVPALAGRLGEGLGFRASREGWVCSPSMLASARSRCRWVLLGTGYPLKLGTGCGERMRQVVGSGLRGAVPALAGRLGEGLGFRASREGMVCSPSMLASARSPYRWVGFGDRLPLETGDRLRGADEAGRGVRAPQGRACARRKARGRFGFSRFARGMGLFAFNARFGTVPLPLGAFGDRLPLETGDRLRGADEAGRGVRAPRDRACARRKALGRRGFRAVREGWVCSPSMLASARSRCRWVLLGTG
jgi:hypothetical protein